MHECVKHALISAIHITPTLLEGVGKLTMTDEPTCYINILNYDSKLERLISKPPLDDLSKVQSSLRHSLSIARFFLLG